MQINRTFRIFVSSTFSDLKAERNALQEKVFQPLRDLAAAHGCRFQAIDLRWGVSEEAALDQQTMKICLGEIERCQKISPRPNFIILLGNRYGWRPLPYEIPVEEYEQIFPLIPEADRAAVLEWYRQDTNALPEPVYVLQQRTGIYKEYETWEPVERRLHSVLETAASKAKLPEAGLVKYTTSATEQEIIQGAFRLVEKDHIFCFAREVDGLPQDINAKDFIDLDNGKLDTQAAQRLLDLKQRLKDVLGKNYLEYTARWEKTASSMEHLDRLCGDVYRDLERVILQEVTALEQVDPLDKEIAAHQAFGQERTRCFVGRADILKKIYGYLYSPNDQPLTVWGASGSGKSALMAKAMEQAQKYGLDTFYRFVGATPESSNVRALLESLCKQISRYYGEDESSIPTGIMELIQKFLECLALATPDKPIFLFLDALDQLSEMDNARNLAWLPASLPPNVHLVVSTLPGKDLQTLEGILPEVNRLEIPRMAREDGKAILRAWFEGVQRKLQDNQEQILLDKFKECGLPLYLKLAFEEARLWKSYDGLPGLSGDIPGILGDLFKRLSQESNHGGMLVSRSLGYLAAAKNGLSEDELLSVLSADGEILADFQRRSPKSPRVDRLPVVVWSRLYLELEPYLAERQADGTSLMIFYHRQLRETVEAGFLAGEARLERHRALARYFGTQSLNEESAGARNPNLRKLSELVYQQALAGLALELVETLTDIHFLTQKSASLGAQALIEDFDLVDETALASSNSLQACKADLRQIQSALRLAAPTVTRQASQLPGQLIGRLAAFPSPVIQDFMQHARAWRGSDWLEPQTASLASAGGPLQATLTGHAYIIIDLVVTPDGKRALSAGGDWSVRVWDLVNGRQEHLIKGMAGLVTALALTPDGRYILAGAMGGTNGHLLALFDMQTGALVQAFDGQAENVRAVGISPDERGAYSVAEDGSICLWSLSRRDPIQTIQADPVCCLAFPPDGKTVAIQPKSDRQDPTRIGIWEIPAADAHSMVQPDGMPAGAPSPLRLQPERPATLIAYSPDGKQLVSVHRGGQPEAHAIHIWDATTGRKIHTLSGHTARILAIDFHPDGSRLFSGGEDGTLRVWDLATGRLVSSLTVGKEAVTALKVTRDGKICLAGNSSGTISVWDLEKLSQSGALPGHSDSISRLVFTPDETAALSASQDYSLKIWDWRQAGKAEEKSVGHAAGITALAFSRDDQLGFSAAKDGSLRIWDLAHASILAMLQAPAAPVQLSRSGSGRMWVGCEDGSLLELDPAKPVLLPNGRIAASQHMAFAEWADGRLAYCVQGPDLSILDPENGQCVGMLEGSHDIHGLWDLVSTPDGAILAGVYWDGRLVVWNGLTGRILYRLKSPRPLLRLALTPEGSRAITGSNDGQISLWDLSNGHSLHSWQAYTGTGDRCWIKSLAISPDGAWAVSGANDWITKLWALPRGDQVAEFAGESECSRCAVSADGQFILAGEISGKVHLLKYNRIS